MLRPSIGIVIAFAAFVSAADVAEAACQQRDLAGRWGLTGIGTTGLESVGVKCNLVINQRGRVDGSCLAQVPGVRESLPIFGGLLRVNRACALGWGGELQLSKDGEVISGIILNPDISVHLTGVKVARRQGAGRLANAQSATSSSEPDECNLLLLPQTSTHATLLRSICQLVAPQP